MNKIGLKPQSRWFIFEYYKVRQYLEKKYVKKKSKKDQN